MRMTATEAPVLKAELYDLLHGDAGVFDRVEVAAVDAFWIQTIHSPGDNWVSPRFWAVVGYNVDDGVPEGGWASLCTAESKALYESAVAKAIVSGKSARQTLYLQHALGYHVGIEVFLLPVAHNSSEYNRLVGILTDKSRERRLEALLNETNTAARIGAWSLELATGTIFWTPMVREIHEIDDEDYVPTLGGAIEFYKEGYSRQRIGEVVQRCIDDDVSWDESLQIRTAKGNFRWVRAIGHAERFNGKVIRLVGSFQDIHQRKLRDLEVAASESLLSTNFDLAPNGMVIADRDGRLERFSKSFAELLKYPYEELAGRSFLDLIHPDDVDSIDSIVSRLSSGEIDSARVEKRYLSKAGATVWVDSALAAIRDDTGELRKISLQLVDVTGTKSAEAYRVHLAFLEHKAKEMEQFAYIASHDLRQPILTFKGYLEVLREDHSDQIDEQGHGYLDVMQAAVGRMDQMIKGLLDYSRVSQARELEEVDLDAVLADVLADVEGLRKRTGGRIQVGNMPTLLGHPVELAQVFQNLITNSLKYHQPDVPPIIAVKCERITSGYEFCVVDNGIGISHSDQDRVFGLFQRLGAVHGYDEGTGIGLANCKTIVERHGGEIGVRSALGQGSTFYFTILTEQFSRSLNQY